MKKIFILLCLYCVIHASVSQCQSHQQSPSSKSLTATGSEWSSIARVPDTHTVSFTLFLSHSTHSLKTLDDIFHRVSDPDSSNYGQFLNFRELSTLLAPPAESVSNVLDWLIRSGVSHDHIDMLPSGDMIRINATAGVVYRLFDTNEPLMLFEHTQTGRTIVRFASQNTARLTVDQMPAHIADAIDFVSGLYRLPRVITHQSRKQAQLKHQTKSDVPLPVDGGNWPNSCLGEVSGLQCGGWIDPGVVRARYQVSNQSCTASGNSMAVAEFSGQYYDDGDLSMFSKACGINPPVKVHKVVGGNSPGVCNDGGCSESLADIEYISAMAPGVPLTSFYTDEYDLVSWITTVAQQTNAPLVHSVSYGEDEISYTHSVMSRVNVEFQKLGVRGCSIFVASGDDGVYGRTGPPLFHPSFPASSPYVTAVGGTYFLNNAVGEEGATSWSGGGFSNVFPRPSYQDQVVTNYLNSNSLPSQGDWNRTGRAFPDIAALSGSNNPFCIVMTQTFQSFAGTSASCPVAAGIFAHLNDVRLNNGKAPFGFLNPLLYKLGTQQPDAFFDVTQGGNGFNEAQGWSPVTGFGTPNFAKLKQYAT
jgi:tripeptidyl-peptidase I